ncbi:UNKNOWN [Stylonychia lemnae]|uniref:Uncharacterized protein n=1 Tax=Stylonychia lemnae TaxID=5949 RepID=A0A077ZU23_STYLE|nr:UNKNOWN [Stylonychia lemnae]|eukprot:CDW73403.1 UNKNOWN [Stylonychia lemnae]
MNDSMILRERLKTSSFRSRSNQRKSFLSTSNDQDEIPLKVTEYKRLLDNYSLKNIQGHKSSIEHIQNRNRIMQQLRNRNKSSQNGRNTNQSNLAQDQVTINLVEEDKKKELLLSPSRWSPTGWVFKEQSQYKTPNEMMRSNLNGFYCHRAGEYEQDSLSPDKKLISTYQSTFSNLNQISALPNLRNMPNHNAKLKMQMSRLTQLNDNLMKNMKKGNNRTSDQDGYKVHRNDYAPDGITSLNMNFSSNSIFRRHKNEVNNAQGGSINTLNNVGGVLNQSAINESSEQNQKLTYWAGMYVKQVNDVSQGATKPKISFNRKANPYNAKYYVY